MKRPVQRELRSSREIKKMRTSGLVVWQAHQSAACIMKPGVTTDEINLIYKETFAQHKAEPLFLGYGTPPFPAETCISINDEVVHGIPGSRILAEGDIVSLDTGCRIAGWCGDAAVTHAIGEISNRSLQLLEITKNALNLAVDLMGQKSRWSEVCKEMEAYINDAHFFIVEELVGHGIGKQLHEPPKVPNFFDAQMMAKGDFELRPGVVIAVEPMVNSGTKNLKLLEDGWTVVTEDGLPSAHFEHTIAITADGPLRLTGPPSDEELIHLPESFHDRSRWVLW